MRSFSMISLKIRGIMKRLLIFIFILILLPISVKAQQKDVVTLSTCVDANQARFMNGLTEVKVKFIGISTDDTILIDGKDFSVADYICSLLKKSKKITLEYEPNLKEDQFGRVQAWVFVDNVLVQENLTKNGYIKPAFVEKNYKYFNKMVESEKKAKENNIGLWKKSEEKKQEEPQKKKKKNIFEIIIDFIVDLFKKLIEFIDKLIKEIF